MIRAGAILLLVLCQAVFVTAQHKYIPIPQDSAIWVVEWEDWHEGTWPPEPHTFFYTIGRLEGIDTLVNGKNYACYFGEYMNWETPLPPPKSISPLGADWFRQDTIAKKVWYMRNQGTPFHEELLYDFSLQKGDTIQDSNSSYLSPQKLAPYKAWVDDLDSIYWPDGTWRYRWRIKSKYGPANKSAEAVQIEGMGYTTHFHDDPLYAFHPQIGATHRVLCFKVKDMWLFKTNNIWNADCDSMTVKNMVPVHVDQIRFDDFSKPLLYPNPVSTDGSITLNSYAGPYNSKCNIQAYNLEGRKVVTATITPGSSLNLSSFSLKPDIYFFIVSTENGTPLVKQQILVQ